MSTAEAQVKYDNYQDAGYTPELYDYHEVADGIPDFAAFTGGCLQQFHAQGFVAVRKGFSGDQVRGALDGLTDLIMGRNPDFRAVQFEAGVKGRLHELTAGERMDAVRKLQYFVGYDERLTLLSKHGGMLRVIQRILGEEPALFANQAILKPPRIGREKPWHQDHAYFNLPVDVPVVSVWIALDPATTDNGCMRVIPGTHRQGPRVHFKRRDWQLCDTHVTRDHVVAVPLEPGGCLIWHGMLHHGTPTNTSPHRRRALQLHYVPRSAGRTSTEERLAVFGSEGKDVTC